MPDFTQQALVTNTAAPGISSGLPVLATITLANRGNNPRTLVQCSEIGVFTAHNIASGAFDGILPAVPTLRYFIFSVYVKSSIAGLVSLYCGNDFIWEHRFDAAGDYQYQFPFGGVLCPSINNGITIGNGAAVVGTFDVLVYAGLAIG